MGQSYAYTYGVISILCRCEACLRHVPCPALKTVSSECKRVADEALARFVVLITRHRAYYYDGRIARAYCFQPLFAHSICSHFCFLVAAAKMHSTMNTSANRLAIR